MVKNKYLILLILLLCFYSVPVFLAPIILNAQTIDEFQLPNGHQPLRITSGPDGNLWFTEPWDNRIGRITPTGTITEFTLPNANSHPWEMSTFEITTGPDGNLWFTEAGRIGRITPTGTITEFTLSNANTHPWGITTGPDGNLWFTEAANNSRRIGRITPTGIITEFALLQRLYEPFEIVSGPDGNLWFTTRGELTNEFPIGQIARITPTGTITEFPLPLTSDYLPCGITPGRDSNLWFNEMWGRRICRITPTGTLTEFILPNANLNRSRFRNFSGITSGPDGNLWFTESNMIGRIVPPQLQNVSVPTLTECGLLIMTALLGLGAIYFMRKRSVA